MLNGCNLDEIKIVNDGSFFELAKSIKEKISGLYDNNIKDIKEALSELEIYIAEFFNLSIYSEIILTPWNYNKYLDELIKKREITDKKATRETNFQDLFKKSNFISAPTDLKEDLLFIKEIEENNVCYGEDDKPSKILIVVKDETIADGEEIFSLNQFVDLLKNHTDFNTKIKNKYEF